MIAPTSDTQPQPAGGRRRSILMQTLHAATESEAAAAAWTADYDVPRALFWWFAIPGLTFAIKAESKPSSIAKLVSTLGCGVSIVSLLIVLSASPVVWAVAGFGGVSFEWWVFQYLVCLFVCDMAVLTLMLFRKSALTMALRAEIRSARAVDPSSLSSITKSTMFNQLLAVVSMTVVMIVLHVLLATETAPIGPWFEYTVLAARLWVGFIISGGATGVVFMCKLQALLYDRYISELSDKTEALFTVADLLAGHMILKRRVRNLSGLTQSFFFADVIGLVVFFPGIVVLLLVVGSPPSFFWVTVGLLVYAMAACDGMLMVAASFGSKMAEIIRQSNNLAARVTIFWKERGMTWAGNVPPGSEQPVDGGTAVALMLRPRATNSSIITAIWESDSDALCVDDKHMHCCDVPQPFPRTAQLGHLPPNEVREFVDYLVCGRNTDGFTIHGVNFDAGVMRTLSSILYAGVLIVLQPFLRAYFS